MIQSARTRACFLMAVALAPCLGSARADIAAPRTLTTSFTYKATVPEIPAGASALDLWIPIPSDSPLQTIRDLTVDAPGPYKINAERRFGNRMVYFHADHPALPFVVTVRFTVDRTEAKVLASDDGKGPNVGGPGARLASYTTPDRLVPVGGRYLEMAKDATAGKSSTLDRMRAIYEQTVANMQYDYKKESPRYAQGDVAFVCDYKKGNCSDLHSYVISLARSLDIPAFLEYGFPLTGIPVPSPVPAEGAISGYHCWTWFHDPDHGWVPLDASDGRRWLDANKPEVKESLFGNLVLERSAVAFSRGRDITLVPPQKAPPLNNFIYPYAEADGKTVEAKWEVRYALPGAAAGPAVNQDLAAQVAELRRLVMDQAREIQDLKAQVSKGAQPAPSKAVAAVPTVPTKESLALYGFLRLDAIMDNGLTNNAQVPLFVLSPSSASVGSTGNRQFTMHPRLTRLGINFMSPTDVGSWKLGGKFEMDWQNGSGVTVESRPLPRIRHAYVSLAHGATNWLFGQTWDVISPLFPSPNDDTLMWGAGNLGDRRPQARFAFEPKTGINTQIALGLTGAIDAKDLDANGVRDGEDSGTPNFQARVGWKGPSTAVGFWGHRAWERTTKPVAGSTLFNSYSLGLDLQQTFGSRWDVKGELWTGKNLSDFRGGIGQGIDPATGTEIRAHGGWGELGYQSSKSHRIAIGYTEDRATDKDVPAGGRLKNDAAYLHNRWKLATNLDVGLNYLFWTTNYKGALTGTDHQFNTFIQHNF